jgi:hypothetical protein
MVNKSDMVSPSTSIAYDTRRFVKTGRILKAEKRIDATSYLIKVNGGEYSKQPPAGVGQNE